MSADAVAVDEDRGRCGQYGEVGAGIIKVGHQRGRLAGLVEGFAEELVGGGGGGLKRGSRPLGVPATVG